MKLVFAISPSFYAEILVCSGSANPLVSERSCNDWTAQFGCLLMTDLRLFLEFQVMKVMCLALETVTTCKKFPPGCALSTIVLKIQTISIIIQLSKHQ